MVPYKLKLLIGRAPYGGKGGIANEFPAVSQWLIETMGKIHRDPRIELPVESAVIADTPVTMTRNRMVKLARERGCDLILMIDSDQVPDVELGTDPLAKPFWDTAFDFVYNHYPKGPCVVGAPYCGPSPDQNVYVFQWANFRNDVPDGNLKLAQYSREQASMMGGIQPVAALPTGLILFDIRCFDLVKPPYFYYQYEGEGKKCATCGCVEPGEQTDKSATEDVTATRDISIAGEEQLRYNPVYCNWDSWAGHVKQEVVVKPRPTTTSEVSAKLHRAVDSGLHMGRQLIQVSPDSTLANLTVHGVSSSESYDATQLAAVNGTMRHRAGLIDASTADGNATKADEVAMRSIVAGIDGEMIVEVGTFIGNRAKLMADAAPRSHIVCVDAWTCFEADDLGVILATHDVYAAWRENCRDYIAAGRIEAMRCVSVEAARLLRHNGYENKLGAVYIDAGHSYEAVKADIEAWLPLVKDGGVLFGHDFDNTQHGTDAIMFPGVRKAVEEAFGDDFERPIPGSSIWVHRVKKPVVPEPMAPVATNGHAKPLPKKTLRKRKALARR